MEAGGQNTALGRLYYQINVSMEAMLSVWARLFKTPVKLTQD